MTRRTKEEVQKAARDMKPGGLSDVDRGTYEIGKRPVRKEVADDLLLYSLNLRAAIQRETSITPALLRHAAELLKKDHELRMRLLSLIERWKDSDNTAAMNAILDELKGLTDEA